MEIKEKPKYYHYMINSNIEQSIRDGEASIDFSGPEVNVPIAHRMLTFPWRGFVIKVKGQLQAAIQNSSNLLELAPALLKSVGKLRGIFGDASKQNVLRPIANCLIEHKERYLSYENNQGRTPLFSSVYDIAIAETESDLFYEDRLNVEIEFIIEDILAGKWDARCEGQPHQYWNEPAPYGGKHSIVYKLQKHREEILKIIEGEVNL